MKTKDFRFRPKTKLGTSAKKSLSRSDAKKAVAQSVEKLADLQERLYADNHHSVLLVFQGMDAAGKDSTINKVMTGINPAGFQVFSFKRPSSEEEDHNFLWRCWKAMPERGRIGIFNRSYYEEVLVVKVHPSIVDSRRIPNARVDKKFWTERYDDIRSMEKHLARNGTRVIKFFLNVSKDEQRARFLSRLNDSEKHWKFSSADMREREHWDAYQSAFRDAMKETDSDDAPWYVIPADDKWTMRAIVADILVEELDGLGLEFPEPDAEEVSRFDEARKNLEADGFPEEFILLGRVGEALAGPRARRLVFDRPCSQFRSGIDRV